MAKGFVSILIVLLTNLIAVGAQLNLFIAKEDVNSHLKLNFNLDLYMIKNNEPATLLKDTRGFYDFMSPLKSTVKGVKMSWFSSPQLTYYSLKLSSSDHKAMANPVASIENQGVVPHSIVSFSISFECTGKKERLVDISMQLNYTKMVGTSVNSSSQKTLFIQVKKWCDKTVKDTDKGSPKEEIHWSRGAIVGLSAGITVFLCICVGLGLLFKHYLKQRRLKMEFDDDLELESKRQFGLKKVTSLPIHKPSSSGPKSPPVLYSPKRTKLRTPKPRQRSETNASDTSTLELICKEESDDERQPREDTLDSGWCESLPNVLVNPEHLEIGEPIGTGSCGDVYHGFLKQLKDNNITEVREVSVEVFKGGQDTEVSKQLLMTAIQKAKQLNHPHIAKPIGVIINPTTQVIMPYMKCSNMNEFLRQHCDTVSHKQLMNIAVKIAKTLEYLNQNHVHKGLSSRECMVDENCDVKVSTFYNNTNIRWMAPECFSSGLFSEKSDVWSFGVILWQMTTFGELPYPEIHTDELFSYLQSGNRLQQNCCDQLYSVMSKCWSIDPVSRPTLHWLVDWLNTYVQSLDTNSEVVC